MVIFVRLQSWPSFVFVLANKILLKRSGESRSSYLAFLLPTTNFVLGTYMGLWAPVLFAHLFDTPLSFLWIVFSDTNLCIKLSSAGDVCNSETGSEGKSTVFEQKWSQNVSIEALLDAFIYKGCFVCWKVEEVEWHILWVVCFFPTAVYRLEANILRW